MIALVQRVNYAAVWVGGSQVARIESGMLVFIGVEKGDTEQNAQALFEKLHKFRVFADADGKLNYNIEQVAGEILLVPQFTLPADTRKGNRPGFESVADPETGKRLFDELVKVFHEKTTLRVEQGIFQTDMKVRLENDGPLTFWLKK